MATEETSQQAEQQPKQPSKIDAALQRFSEMLIQRMEEMQRDWNKTWIGGGTVFGLPQNFSGRTYEGCNAFLLFMHTAKNNYHAPVYMTHSQIFKEGAHVLKGEKAIPVFKWGLSIKDKDGKKMSESDYRELTKEEQDECKVRPYLKVYPEWNVDQTNLSEVNKEKYDAVIGRFKRVEIPKETKGMYVNAALDRMMEKQEWVCPIQYDKEEKGAYYSPGEDRVVLPMKSQFNTHPDNPEECFKDGMAFYGVALHEMAHSTGHKSRLDRLKPSLFGSPEYAKEELVAELTSAMVGNSLGFDRRISDNNVAYLQNWTSVLRKEPKFIVAVMSDVNKACRMEIENIDKQRVALGEKPLVQGVLDGAEEKAKNEQQLATVKEAKQDKLTSKESELLQLLGLPDQKEYYNEIDLSTTDKSTGDSLELYDKAQLSELWLNGENDRIIEILKTTKEEKGATLDGALLSSFKGEISNAEKLGEDNNYVYYLSSNDSENFQMYEKVSRETLLRKYLPLHLDRELLSVEGYDNEQINAILAKAKDANIQNVKLSQEEQSPTKEETGKIHQEDPKEVVAKEWASLDEKPTVTMESGDVLPVTYNKEKDTMEVEYVNEQGEKETYSEPYDHDRDINGNLGYIWEGLSNMKQFQAVEKVEESNDIPNPKEYFSTLMTTINDGQHEEHTALDIKNMTELREYFKENPHIGEWVSAASNKELIEAGADMLPNLRYSHKDGRTLWDMTAAYSNINAQYEDVTDDRTRQIAHRVEQAKAIISAYQDNIENAHEEGFLFNEDAAHKMLPREEYAANLSQTQTQTTEQDMNKEEKYYFSYQYLQSTDSTEEFDNLQEKQDYKSMLYLAKEYDQGDALEQGKTFKNAEQYSGDDILDEDDKYAVVYNNSVGGTYSLMRKVSKENIIDNIERYGLENDATDDVKKIAYENVAKQFSKIKNMPAFTMPNEDVLYFQYNQEENKLEVGTVTNVGLSVHHSFDYDVDRTLDDNLENAYEQLSELPEYQQVDEEEEEETEYESVESIKENNQFLNPKADKDKKQEQTAVPHEDSNIETNVGGVAEKIAETGVPMAEAEKEAKNIVDDKQHEAFHEEEAKQQEKAKAAQAKAEQEKAEKEKTAKEQQKNEDKQENGIPQKVLTHASILLGALALAKENDGVWMNKEGKSNAEFMYSHTPITAYNNIMMNLDADQKGYRSNTYAYYNSAKANGIGVRPGEKALPFNWTQWDYQNVTNKDDIISKAKYDKLPDEEKRVYEKHASRITQFVYNIDQTTFPAAEHEKYVAMLKEKGAQQEDLKVVPKDDTRLQHFNMLHKKHPDSVILVRNQDTYETYKDNAKTISEVLGLPLKKENVDGKEVSYASFSFTRLDNYLPKIIRAGNRVAICDMLENPKLVKSVQESANILNRAYQTAKDVAEQSGAKYERVMVMQDAKYDKAADKIVVSGMRSNSIGSERIADIQKANDIYRAVVASTGIDTRLDRSGRNNLLPEDDAKHELLVRELAAGVLMARQGLPATLSKESQKLIPYWEREIKENPKMVGVIERDVNNAVETIDNLVAKRKVNYEAIRGQLPSKMITEKPKFYTIATDLAKLPSIDTKEIVVVKDTVKKTADVILPAGASLEVDNEVPGMRKDRIGIALKKEGFETVKFYNAGGTLGLNKSNDYFQGKEVSLNQLKQYQLVNHKTIDVAEQAKQGDKVDIVKFQALKGDNGRYAFFIKPKDEPSFSVYPPKEHISRFFNVIHTTEEKATHEALARKWYEIATKDPSIRVDLITPKKVDVDMSKIVRPTITSSSQDHNQKLVIATVNGKTEVAPITKEQFNKMWLADDMAEYKKAIAAIAFEPLLNKGVEKQQTETVKEAESVEVKDTPSPAKKQEEEVRRGGGMHM